MYSSGVTMQSYQCFSCVFGFFVAKHATNPYPYPSRTPALALH